MTATPELNHFEEALEAEAGREESAVDAERERENTQRGVETPARTSLSSLLYYILTGEGCRQAEA